MLSQAEGQGFSKSIVVRHSHCYRSSQSRSSLFLVLSCTRSHPGSHSQSRSCFHPGSCPCFMTWWYGLDLTVTFIKIPNKWQISLVTMMI